MKKHTELPWYKSVVQQDEWGIDFCTIGPFDIVEKFNEEMANETTHYEDTICEVSGANHDVDANSDFILESVNNHYKYKKALEDIRDHVEGMCNTSVNSPDWMRVKGLANQLLQIYNLAIAQVGINEN